MSVTATQIRGARGMLDWSMLDLARAAGVSVSTVKRMETPALQPVSDDIYVTVRMALEAAGMRFFGGDGETGMALRAG